jgi:D-3-phosphoglycerate dehydrogenase
MDRAPNLKVLARAAVGYGNIDVDYATSKGILVFNTPALNTNSAAELSVGLLLAAVRKICVADEAMREGKWDRHRFTGTELMGKTIGLLGLGNVGHRVARFCHGFEMRVIACDPYIPDETFERHGAEKVDLDTLLREADVVSIHVPKNKETNGMISAEGIAKMKDGVVVVNAARGGIIKEKALLDALKSGKVAAAGIDTWEIEPPKDNPFAKLPNVVMTPHIGASTEEAQYRIALAIADQVPKALRGGVVDSPVNMPQIRMFEGNLMSSYAVLCERLGSFAAQYIDFEPKAVSCVFRGDLSKHDCQLLRLAFLKGYLNAKSLSYVSYVNAERRAEAAGLFVNQLDDPKFTAYDSAVKFVLSNPENSFELGGVVFSGPHPRITLVDGYSYESAPEGDFLLVRCRNRLGVLASVSAVLDKHGVLIKRLDFSDSSTRKRTMFMFRAAKAVPQEVLDDLKALDDVLMAKKISI